ncbi:porin family protein [bacterium]|nr:porin family protein [bacterium]
MKKVLLVLFIIVLAASLVQAADDIRPKCKKGDRSLLFSFNGVSGLLLNGLGSIFGGEGGDGDLAGLQGHPNLNTSTLYSPGVGGLYYMSDYTALRFGIGYANVKNAEDEDGDVTDSNAMMAISAGLQYHIATATAVSIYTGGEFYYGTLSATAEDKDAETESTTSYNGIGVAGLIGAQFYPWKNVSLDMEYQIGYASFSSSGEYTIGDDSDDWKGGSTTVMGISNWGITLNIHF